MNWLFEFIIIVFWGYIVIASIHRGFTKDVTWVSNPGLRILLRIFYILISIVFVFFWTFISITALCATGKPPK